MPKGKQSIERGNSAIQLGPRVVASILGAALSIAVDLIAALGVLAFVGALCLACGG